MRLTLFLAVLLALTVTPAHAATRVALVIGNAAYESLQPLANPANDAALMARTLRDLGFEVIERRDATRRQMAEAVLEFGRRLRAAGQQGVGLFYFAGHGVQSRGLNYMIPVGSPIESEAMLEIEAVRADWVLQQMGEAGNTLNVVILDACRNNPFAGRFRSASRGLARMDAPSGSYLAYAAKPGQAAEDGRSANSPYTAALARTMQEPGLKLEDVFKRVRVEVERLTASRQTPWEEGAIKGDFYFTPVAAMAGALARITEIPDEAPPPTPDTPGFDERAIELSYWESVRDSDNPRALESYLDRYPRGIYSALARIRLQELHDQSQGGAPATPEEPGPGFEVEALDAAYVATTRSNVRAGPSTDHEKVALLEAGEGVTVTGRVEGGPWLRIALPGGGEGFVHGSLLQERGSWEAARAEEARRQQQAAVRPPQSAVARPPGQVLDGPRIEWRHSLWGRKRAFSAGIETLAEIVAERSGGRFTIEIRYGEALSNARDTLDGIARGLFESATFCNSHRPAETPVFTVFSLPFLPVADRRTAAAVREAVFAHPAAVAEMDRWNAMTYVSTLLPQDEVLGTGKPPVEIEDWAAMRVRAGRDIGKALERLGARVAMLPAPKVHAAIRRGAVDAVSLPFTVGHVQHRVHEVADWFTTNLSPGSAECTVVFNKASWAALPERYRTLVMDAKPEVIAAQIRAYEDIDEVNLPMLHQRLTPVTYSDQQLAEFRRIAGKPVWERWVEANADRFDARGVLALVLTTAEAALTQ